MLWAERAEARSYMAMQCQLYRISILSGLLIRPKLEDCGRYIVQGSLLKAMLRVHWRRLGKVGVLEIGSCCFMLLSPYLLQQLLLELQHGTRTGALS